MDRRSFARNLAWERYLARGDARFVGNDKTVFTSSAQDGDSAKARQNPLKHRDVSRLLNSFLCEKETHRRRGSPGTYQRCVFSSADRYILRQSCPSDFMFTVGAERYAAAGALAATAANTTWAAVPLSAVT